MWVARRSLSLAARPLSSRILQRPHSTVPADPDADPENRVKSAHREMSEGSSLRPLYLDAQATTPLDPRALDAMLPYLTSQYGNPHSRTHAYGWESEEAVEEARAQVSGHTCYCKLLCSV